MTTDDKGLTLVPQILAAHQAYVTAQKGGLDHAFEAGRLLNLAKETVLAGNGDKRGKWEKWRTEHIPTIPESTAVLYMRLAKHKDEIVKQQCVIASLADGGKLTLREADKLIPKTDKQKERSAKAAATRQANKIAKEEEARAAAKSSNVEDMLEAIAPDELFIAVRDAWEVEQIGELATKLGNYALGKGWKPPTPPEIPAVPAEPKRAVVPPPPPQPVAAPRLVPS
jgi:hypothetical protein